LRNTCHGPRTSFQQRVFHPTDHVQQDISPTHNPRPLEWKSGAGEAQPRGGRRRGLLPSSARQSLRALVMQSSAPAPSALSPWDSALGAIEDLISQCPFLQMTYTAESPHADGSPDPGGRPSCRPPRRHHPHDTSPAPMTTGWPEDRCPVVGKQPLHSLAAAKMSQHIHIGQEPVLADHAPSPAAADSHCPARDRSSLPASLVAYNSLSFVLRDTLFCFTDFQLISPSVITRL
jgi:hypothetical protein